MIFGRLPLSQIVMAAFVGVAGGIYVYKPIYEQYYRDQKSSRNREGTGNVPGKEETDHSKEANCGCKD